MTRTSDMTTDDLQHLRETVRRDYEAFKGRGLKLDMTRGKPAPDQLDLADGLIDIVDGADAKTKGGVDTRNYGGLQGLPALRSIFVDVLGAPVERIVGADNSSLALMHDCIAWALLRGVPGGARPWLQEERPTFICPVPGYDRHFAICEEYGIHMLPVPMTKSGPDMEAVERLALDPSVKGMWCVPKYSNPGGEVYSDATVQRLASMKTGASDFRLFWDNAYAVHHLTAHHHAIANVLDACEAAGHPDRAFVFASTSKVTLAGAGVAFFAGSAANVKWYLARAEKRTIGPDKINHLRHALFLKDEAGLARHMERHQALIAPKFDAVLEALDGRLGDKDVARWSRPEGGYFISVDAMDGTASRIVTLAKEAGVALTPAGATWPLNKDPNDRTIRLAPTFPTLSDVEAASEGIAICILLAALEKMAA